MIKGKTPEEIRKLFNIVNDFTPEEEVHSLFVTAKSRVLTCILTGADQERERKLINIVDDGIVADDVIQEWAEDR